MSRAADRADEALAELIDGLGQIRNDVEFLAAAAAEAQDLRGTGLSWWEVLDQTPALAEALRTFSARTGSVGAPLRRSLVADLRDAGLTLGEIASLFSVTHQRVSNLLREDGVR